MKGECARQYVIYSRKSKFTGKGESIENQIELCRQYIRLRVGDKRRRKPSCTRTKASPAAIWSGLSSE
jgi:hypothetical protein